MDNGSSLTEDQVILLLEFFFLYMVFSVLCVQTESVACVCMHMLVCMLLCMYLCTVQFCLLVHTPG